MIGECVIMFYEGEECNPFFNVIVESVEIANDILSKMKMVEGNVHPKIVSQKSFENWCNKGFFLDEEEEIYKWM